MRVLVLFALACLLSGCTRAFYQRQADREVYHIVQERNCDPRWHLPSISITPPPQSRIFDPFDINHLPMPPDDPAADKYMRCVFGMHGYRHWHRYGDAPWIEDPEWKKYLELDANGVLVLTPERAVEIGILNSFAYQTQLENLYLTALPITLDRYQFELMPFATNDTTFTHFGSSADELNTFTTNTTIGFTRTLATAGQIMAEFANSFVFQYAGKDTTIGFSNIIINYFQPLLQNAGRAVALETLTEAERTLLYAVRNFAHFRKQYTFQVATSTYLSLLSQDQQVRNQQANINALEQNLRLHVALLDAGKVAALKVEQVDIQLQQGQQMLIQIETALERAQDAYKRLLGLPPDIPIRLDDSLLKQFQLNDPAITDLQQEISNLQAIFRAMTEAPLADLRAGFKKLETFHARAFRLMDDVAAELDRWKKRLQERDPKDPQQTRAQANYDQVAPRLTAVRAELDDLKRKMALLATALAQSQRKEGTEELTRITANLSETIAGLFVIQTRIRVHLIELPPANYDLAQATTYALNNRLDLMNQEAQVVDAWRQITVTASALKAGLNLLASANIATPPLGDRPFDFRASASTYSVGVHIDAPLNRLAQRNAYRASQIFYEQARRAYMSLEDTIIEQIREDLRQLRLNRVTFNISRQSVVSAALSYEATRQELLSANASPTATLDTLRALNDLLVAENTLIGAWAAYETTRYQLLLDMEALQLDARGLYINGYDNEAGQPANPDASNSPQRLPASP